MLPLLPWRHRWAVLLPRTRQVTALLAVCGVILVLVTDGGLPGRLAGAMVLGGVLVHVLATVVARWTVVDVRPDVTGEWVRLQRVHPDFVAATEAVTTRPTTTPTTSRATTPTTTPTVDANDRVEV